MTTGDKPALQERLRGLARFVSMFESPGFEFGRLIEPEDADTGVRLAPCVVLGPTADSFIRTCYDDGWVLQDFDWARWAETPEAVQLRDDAAALGQASSEQIAHLLTVVIRLDRFNEGTLQQAFESGLLVRIVRRAAALEATGGGDST